MTSEPPAPGPRSRKPMKKPLKRILVVLTVLLTLCCVGGATVTGIVGYSLSKAPQAEAEMRAFGEALANHLEAGEYDAIYDALSADARGRYSREEFVRRLADQPRPSAHTIDDEYVLLWLCYITVTLTYADGHTGGAHTFDLVEEGTGWKVTSDLLHDLTTGPRHGGGGGHHGGHWGD